MMLDARCPDRGGGSFAPASQALARHKRFSLPDAFSGLIYSIFCIFLSFDALIESFAPIMCGCVAVGGQRAWRLSITLDDGTGHSGSVSVGGCARGGGHGHEPAWGKEPYRRCARHGGVMRRRPRALGRRGGERGIEHRRSRMCRCRCLILRRRHDLLDCIEPRFRPPLCHAPQRCSSAECSPRTP